MNRNASKFLPFLQRLTVFLFMMMLGRTALLFNPGLPPRRFCGRNGVRKSGIFSPRQRLFSHSTATIASAKIEAMRGSVSGMNGNSAKPPAAEILPSTFVLSPLEKTRRSGRLTFPSPAASSLSKVKFKLSDAACGCCSARPVRNGKETCQFHSRPQSTDARSIRPATSA